MRSLAGVKLGASSGVLSITGFQAHGEGTPGPKLGSTLTVMCYDLSSPMRDPPPIAQIP